VWTAGSVLVGGTVEGSIVDVVWTAGDALVGGVVEGGVVNIVCVAGSAVAGSTRGGNPGLWDGQEGARGRPWSNTRRPWSNTRRPWSNTYLCKGNLKLGAGRGN
jgi:hypothetical protein